MARKAMMVLAVVGSLASFGCSSQQSSATATASGGTATAPASAATPSRSMRVETIAKGLEHPWSVALLPDGAFLVTERPGRLRRVAADGTLGEPIANVPAVYAEGQGGLLDVVLAPDFATSKKIYLSFAEPADDGTAGTAVATATLVDTALHDVRVIYRQQPKLTGGAHFGSRIVFDGHGHVFISQGERQDRMKSQQLNMLQGKLVRLNLDGSVPRDNPFVGRKDARPEIWSYGHRNMQGLALDPRTGTLWESEHGPRGGDEINIPQAGKNYGWPIITWGIDYPGYKIAESVGSSAPGMEQPHHYWAKSPGLSGMAFFTGRPGSAWNDSLFLGSLAESNLIRLSLKGNAIVGEERLLQDEGARIRDVRVGNDGNVYVLTDAANGKLLRLTPPGT
ncbi:PQQ-dependent sugar dehydrogenase [Noviluteimonas gilva]|uniref:PQQ-dependent sugar dehydrogenase n=1 Tax=Noviluteimonas gilva TaxID=2682097 RepID=A0A7C9M1N7_9GAMM|nr:PQQ-dependent sugar dehydrogenase [Lysobacter gilvus]MUV14468.1 PQQ-dependent sugar dehydrogenase [Lysobacter gilvus]